MVSCDRNALELVGAVQSVIMLLSLLRILPGASVDHNSTLSRWSCLLVTNRN